MKRRTLLVLSAMLFCSLPGLSRAGAVHTVPLSSNDVETRLDTSAGSSYSILRVAIPGEVTATGFVRAFLELRADVDARAIDGWVNETPVVEVYLLAAEMVGDFDRGKLRDPSSMNRPVVIGTNKSVRIDITEAVKYWLENPTANHGLVLGSFRGAREGLFSLRTDPGRDGALAAVTFLCR